MNARQQKRKQPGFHAALFNIFLIVWAIGSFTARAADDAYPTDRRTGLTGGLWTNTGIQNGHRLIVTTIYTNITALAITASQFNTVIQNCPSNQVIKLTNGTFTGLGSGKIFAKNGVVIRGTTNAQGHPLTILNNAGIAHATSDYYYPSGPVNGWPAKTTRSITAGLSEGSTSITVSSPPNADFALGDIMLIDQVYDGTLIKDDTQNDTYTRNTRPYCQAVQILTTNATTITFQPALLGTNWNLGQTPEAVGWSQSVGKSIQNFGIEDLDFPSGCVQEIYTLRLGPAYQCWVYNVRLKVDTSGAIRFTLAVNCAVTACTFHDTTGTGSGTYALLPGPSTMGRYENNICTNTGLFIPCQASVGDSFSFNYTAPPIPYSTSTWLPEHMFPHGGHSHHSIWEGNHTMNVYIDDVFSNNNSDLGIVRNRLIGWASGKTSNTKPVAIGETDGGTGNHRNTTVIGNVLGENSYHGSYASLWYIDPVVTGTIRTNNFNTVNDGVPGTETMASGVTMRNSYVYPARPEWFGDRPWPAYDPQTLSSTNVLSYTNIPAGYRSYFGEWPAPAQGGGGGEPPVGGQGSYTGQSAVSGPVRMTGGVIISQ